MGATTFLPLLLKQSEIKKFTPGCSLLENLLASAEKKPTCHAVLAEWPLGLCLDLPRHSQYQLHTVDTAEANFRRSVP